MGLLNVLRQRHPRFFLSRKEVGTLSRRIDVFEKLTGCEIVFHFRKTLNENPLEETQRLFLKFGLHKTHHRAAILVVISLWDRKFAVWADECGGELCRHGHGQLRPLDKLYARGRLGLPSGRDDGKLHRNRHVRQ